MWKTVSSLLLVTADSVSTESYVGRMDIFGSGKTKLMNLPSQQENYYHEHSIGLNKQSEIKLQFSLIIRHKKW